MGSPVNHYRQKESAGRNEKVYMHSGGIKNLNLNLFLLACQIRPQLSVLDGIVGMEGNGPTRGTPVEHGVVLAGNDSIAVDRVAVELMGINFNDIGYLTYCANAGFGQSDLSHISVIGPEFRNYVKHYKLPDNIENLLGWKQGLE